jgi:uncharacterized protein (DUF2252 family)
MVNDATANLHAPDFVDDIPHPSPEERSARGRAARDRVPRGLHGEWEPAEVRSPIAILEEQATTRDSGLVPVRHGRMLESPFAFFRGAAAIMAADLATTVDSGIEVQLCGDAHLLNFGMFRTSEQALTFDINDFDETHPGPWEWDVKRLAASFEIAGRDLGMTASKRRRAIVALVAAYRDAMASFATMGNLALWHVRLDVRHLLDDLREQKADPERVRRIERSVRQALKRNHLTAFDRLVEDTSDGLRFSHRPPQLVPIEHLIDQEGRVRYQEVIAEFLRQYRDSLRPVDRHIIESYRFVHMARKVVGVGSVGTRAWVVLMVGRGDDDPLLLQLKEAQPSVLEAHLGPSRWPTSGERVVHGQRLMQGFSDPLLGWYELEALDHKRHAFYVRQLWDGKASIGLTGVSSRGLADYGRLCGWTIAKAHARTGDRIAITSYIGSGDRFGEAIADFAVTYADLNERDHAALTEAVASGRLGALRGV